MDASLVDELADAGFVVRDAFLSTALCRALRAALHERSAAGEFRPALIAGDARGPKYVPADRGDEIRWLPEPADRELRAAESRFLARIETLRRQLNAQLSLGVFEFEAHYARYEPGRGYVRHSDRRRGSDARVVSIVVYLNDEWREEWGGQLRLYPPGRAAVDVLPSGGRLVMFFSDGLEHEVLPARRPRESIAGWLRRRGETQLLG
ncbi:MAG: 2OG-Fe(II) oxygenase [Steroidobacteraceae bacterium]|nr:2OG-Fe(II) oxygenase [Steroidobacteraceae bacterium]MDW8260132.1 2OG-Fe(II) oxygenase [Gammaproteobacteria bacterium]